VVVRHILGLFDLFAVDEQLEAACAQRRQLAEDDVLGDAEHLLDLAVDAGAKKLLDSLLEAGLAERAFADPVEAVATDGLDLAVARHEVGERDEVALVDVDAVDVQDHLDLLNDGLPGRLDAQVLLHLNAVVGEGARVVDELVRQDFLQVGAVRLQEPLLGGLDAAVLGQVPPAVLLHEDLLDIGDSLKLEVLEQLVLDGLEHLHLLVLGDARLLEAQTDHGFLRHEGGVVDDLHLFLD